VKIRTPNTPERHELMQEQKNQYDLADKELRRLLDSIVVIPYSALPLEQPQIICFARRIEELTGYTADEILANRQLWMSVVYPADRDRVFAAFTRCKNLGIPFEIEYRIIHKDGSLRYVIDEGEPVFNDKGQVTEIEGIITDVGESKKARICVCQRNPEATRLNNVNSDVFQKI
jgi:PAS domain S-box-containing protein